jgi:hypothetical protein
MNRSANLFTMDTGGRVATLFSNGMDIKNIVTTTQKRL